MTPRRKTRGDKRKEEKTTAGSKSSRSSEKRWRSMENQTLEERERERKRMEYKHYYSPCGSISLKKTRAKTTQ